MIRFGTTDEIISHPISYGVEQSGFDATLVRNQLEANCALLLDGRLDAALISPRDYALNTSSLRIYPSLSVYSQGATGYAILFFGKLTDGVSKTFLFDPMSQYRNLAEVVCREFYEIDLDFAELDNGRAIETVIEGDHSLFLDRERALSASKTFERGLDLVEDWSVRMEMSFTHQLLCVAKDSNVPGDLLNGILASTRRVLANPGALVDSYPGQRGAGEREHFYHLITDTFGYFPGDETWASLQGYLEYLFYFGMLDYIPQFHWS